MEIETQSYITNLLKTNPKMIKNLTKKKNITNLKNILTHF